MKFPVRMIFISVSVLVLLILFVFLPTRLRRTPARAEPDLPQGDKIGVNTKNWWMWPIQFDEAKFEPYISAIQKSGVKYVRIFAHWSALRANRDYWREDIVQRMDAMLLEMKNSSLEPVVVFFQPPDWASLSPDGQNRDDYLISDIPAWKDFVAVMVSRYGYAEGGKQYVRYWEILNEPDLPTRKYTAADYTQVLEEVYPVIKQEDSQAQVLLGGLSQLGWRDFLPELLNRGGGDFFDILSMHVYDTPDRITLAFEKFREVLQNNSVSKPIWVTEVNWGRMNYLTTSLEDHCPQPDDEDQWLVFKEDFDNLLNTGAEKVFWHQARCSVWGPGFIEWNSELPESPQILIREKSFDAFKNATGADGLLPGDTDGDGVVDGMDLELLKQDYLGAPTNNTDFNSDGRVDIEDFAVIQSNYEGNQ